MKVICAYIRLNDDGSFSKVTWRKALLGVNVCKVEPYIPSSQEAKAIFMAPNQELLINHQTGNLILWN